MRTAIAVEKGITKIPWQLVCRVYRMSGFRMLIPRGKEECLIVFDTYNDALDGMRLLGDMEKRIERYGSRGESE